MGNSKKIKNQENPMINDQENPMINDQNPPMENPQIESSIDPLSSDQGLEEFQDQLIKDMENPPMENPPMDESPKKISKIRSYNNPLFKSKDLEDLSSISFPLKFEKENEKGEKIEEIFENKFGNLKKGDIFNMKLNPNNRNSFPIGKILFFRIQSNGFWIKYLSIDGKKYFKNLNLFISLSNDQEIKDFEDRLKLSLESQKSEKSEK